MNTWDSLSMAQRAEVMKLAVQNGIYSLDTIRGAYNEYAKGGGIHIDPSKKGTFTAAASRHNIGVQEFASKVLANKDDYSTAMVKKANFAKNARKWKHGFGGPLFDSITPNLFEEGGGFGTRSQAVSEDLGNGWYKTTAGNYVNGEGLFVIPDNSEAGYRIQLPEVTVTGKIPERNKPKSNKPYWVSPRGAGNMSLTAGEAMKGVDAAIGPLLHWLSPSQYVGAVRDAANGENPLLSMLRGNSGVVSEEYAQEHPYLSTLFNIGTDAVVLGGPSAVRGIRNYNYTHSLGRPQVPEGFSEVAPKARRYEQVFQDGTPAAEWAEISPNLEQQSLRDLFNITPKTGLTLTEPEVRASLEAAKDYKNSQGYRLLVENARRESQQLGIGDFSENLFLNSGNPEFPAINISARPKNKLGGYRRSDNTINLDPAQLSIEEAIGAPYHEGIHWQRVGNPEITSPKYKAWVKSLDKSKDLQDKAWLEFVSSDEYPLLGQRNNARDYLEQKIRAALYEDAEPYLRIPGELQANGIEAGRVIGLKPFSSYPGLQKALEAVESARKYNSYLWDVKAGGEDEVKNFWNIITGQYAPTLIPAAIGIASRPDNK